MLDIERSKDRSGVKSRKKDCASVHVANNKKENKKDSRKTVSHLSRRRRRISLVSMWVDSESIPV